MHFRGQGQSSEGSEATANILIKRLDEKRQERWIERVESMTSHTHQSKNLTHFQLPHCITATPKWLIYQPRQRQDKFEKEVAEQWKVNDKDVNMSAPFPTGQLVEAR